MMIKIQTNKAFYIKLGFQGAYESECLTNPGIARIGWSDVPRSMLDSEADQIIWKAIKSLLNNQCKSKGMATNQTNQLKNFFTSGPSVLWITFYSNRLYWCFLDPKVEISGDNTKFRRTLDGWHCTDIQDKELTFNRLSGSLSTLKGFLGTICAVHELDYLLKKINGETSPEEDRVENAKI